MGKINSGRQTRSWNPISMPGTAEWPHSGCGQLEVEPTVAARSTKQVCDTYSTLARTVAIFAHAKKSKKKKHWMLWQYAVKLSKINLFLPQLAGNISLTFHQQQRASQPATRVTWKNSEEQQQQEEKTDERWKSYMPKHVPLSWVLVRFFPANQLRGARRDHCFSALLSWFL